MKFLKYHVSIVLPLFLLLFAVESFYMLKRVINNYEQKINNEYSIVVVSKVPLDEKIVADKISNLSELKIINVDNVLNNLKNNISANSLKKIKNNFPIFYSVKLKYLPNSKELSSMKRKLKDITGVKSVTTFKKNYDKFYNFLTFNKILLLFFTIFVSIIVWLLIIKQAEVWIFEHKQRFEIMSILGAPFWMKSAMLYRVVIVDSIISSVLVSLVFLFISTKSKTINHLSGIDIPFPQFHIFDSFILFGIGIFISVVSVTFAILKLNKE